MSDSSSQTAQSQINMARIDIDKVENFKFDEIKQEILEISRKSYVESFIKVNKNWNGVALYGPNGMSKWNLGLGGNFLGTELLDLMPDTKEFLTSLPLILQSVRVSSLGPQGRIMPHRDFDLHGGLVRLHVVIATNDKVKFQIGNKTYTFRDGDFFLGNFSLPHSVHNDSEEERIHIIIDGYCTDKTFALFEDDAADFLKAVAVKQTSPLLDGLLGRFVDMTFDDGTSKRPMLCRIEKSSTGIGLKLAGTPVFVGDILFYEEGFIVNGTPYKLTRDESRNTSIVVLDTQRIKEINQLLQFGIKDNVKNESRSGVSLTLFDDLFEIGKIQKMKQMMIYLYIVHLLTLKDRLSKSISFNN